MIQCRRSKTDTMTSKFLKVKCEECNNEQVIFERPSTKIKCSVCDTVLAEPTGGRANIKTRILEVMK